MGRKTRFKFLKSSCAVILTGAFPEHYLIKMLSVSGLVWNSNLGFPGVLFASCPKDVSLILSVMTNTAQLECGGEGAEG